MSEEASHTLSSADPYIVWQVGCTCAFCVHERCGGSPKTLLTVPTKHVVFAAVQNETKMPSYRTQSRVYPEGDSLGEQQSWERAHSEVGTRFFGSLLQQRDRKEHPGNPNTASLHAGSPTTARRTNPCRRRRRRLRTAFSAGFDTESKLELGSV